MKSMVLFAVVAAGALTTTAIGQTIPGVFNGWDPNTAYNGASGGGVFVHDVTGEVAGSQVPWAHLAVAGDWGTKIIGSGDQWGIIDGSGNLTISLDTNSAGDGWSPDANRVQVSNFQTNWTAVGDWQNQAGGAMWDNANTFTTMSSVGGSIYSMTATLADGTYAFKAVKTGSWDAIGADSRSINADNFSFSVTAPNNTITFSVDAALGVIRVDAIPTPGALALLGFGGLIGLRRRR